MENTHTLTRCIAWVTRAFHARGTGRFLRMFFNPDTMDGFETVIRYDGDLKMHVNPSSFIEWEIFFKGHYEPAVTKLIKEHLRPGGVFVDVGANVGVHTLVGARIAREVIALEPVPEIAERLRANCELNGLTNVRILPYAASDAEGTVPFFLATARFSNRGVGSLYPEHAKGEEIRVEMRTLDSVLAGTRVDLMKIDTERNDGRVILGAREVIASCRPILIFEYEKQNWVSAGVTLEEVKRVLPGYEVRMIGNDAFAEMLCVPRERGGR
jgi:FkbM family methyltransferase